MSQRPCFFGHICPGHRLWSISTFIVPKESFVQWYDIIKSATGYSLNFNSRLCEYHFDKDDIIEPVNGSGQPVLWPKPRKRLVKGAKPCRFSGIVRKEVDIDDIDDPFSEIDMPAGRNQIKFFTNTALPKITGIQTLKTLDKKSLVKNAKKQLPLEKIQPSVPVPTEPFDEEMQSIIIKCEPDDEQIPSVEIVDSSSLMEEPALEITLEETVDETAAVQPAPTPIEDLYEFLLDMPMPSPLWNFHYCKETRTLVIAKMTVLDKISFFEKQIILTGDNSHVLILGKFKQSITRPQTREELMSVIYEYEANKTCYGFAHQDDFNDFAQLNQVAFLDGSVWRHNNCNYMAKQGPICDLCLALANKFKLFAKKAEEEKTRVELLQLKEEDESNDADVTIDFEESIGSEINNLEQSSTKLVPIQRENREPTVQRREQRRPIIPVKPEITFLKPHNLPTSSPRKRKSSSNSVIQNIKKMRDSADENLSVKKKANNQPAESLVKPDGFQQKITKIPIDESINLKDDIQVQKVLGEVFRQTSSDFSKKTVIVRKILKRKPSGDGKNSLDNLKKHVILRNMTTQNVVPCKQEKDVDEPNWEEDFAMETVIECDGS